MKEPTQTEQDPLTTGTHEIISRPAEQQTEVVRTDLPEAERSSMRWHKLSLDKERTHSPRAS